MNRAYGSLATSEASSQRVKTRCYKMGRGYASCIPFESLLLWRRAIGSIHFVTLDFNPAIKAPIDNRVP